MQTRPVASAQPIEFYRKLQAKLSKGRKEEADLRDTHSQLPPFTATKAAARIQATTELTAEMLMARTTQVSRIADKGMDDIVKVMRQLGYEARTTQNKAFYTTVFTHEGEPEHTFEMVGWHGTGKFAGGEKTILEFYDDDHSTEKPVVAIGVINEANINPNRQKEVVQDILDYVKNHG